MNWLDRARPEISENAIRPAANTAERNLTAVTAVQENSLGSSNGSNGSTPSFKKSRLSRERNSRNVRQSWNSMADWAAASQSVPLGH
jgi:hypothetical protein